MSCVIDVRTREAYDAGHMPDAFSFPWEDIHEDACGLPTKDTALTVVVDESIDACAVRALFRELCYSNVTLVYFSALSHTTNAVPVGFPWAPNPFLEEVITKVEATVGVGVALDVGTGSGRDMVYLGHRGWHVLGIDNVERRLRQAFRLAQRHGTDAHVCAGVVDVRAGYPFRPGCFDLINVCRFIHRPSFSQLAVLVKVGGLLLYSHFLEGCQHTTIGHPKTVKGFFLSGELEALLQQHSFALLVHHVTLLQDGRPFIHVLAQRQE